MRLNNIQLKRAVSVVLFFMLLSAVGLTKAFGFTVGDFNYSVNSDGTTVTVTSHVNGTAATGELVIPETVTYNGSNYSVTAIGSGAFRNCTGFTGNLVIPTLATRRKTGHIPKTEGVVSWAFDNTMIRMSRLLKLIYTKISVNAQVQKL